jgi:hypothetical protein
MERLKLFVALAAVLCTDVALVGSAQDKQDQLTIDATKQQSGPVRGRGPFPGSATPGHSAGLPIRLELQIPTGELRPDGTTVVDFIITSVGTETIKLPSILVSPNNEGTEVLTLWLTSDGIRDQYVKDQQTGRLFKFEAVVISAELYGRSDNPRTFMVLVPNTSMRVHASSRVQLNPGTHSITAHTELMRISNGKSEIVGTADSEAVTKMLSASGP